MKKYSLTLKKYLYLILMILIGKPQQLNAQDVVVVPNVNLHNTIWNFQSGYSLQNTHPGQFFNQFPHGIMVVVPVYTIYINSDVAWPGNPTNNSLLRIEEIPSRPYMLTSASKPSFFVEFSEAPGVYYPLIKSNNDLVSQKNVSLRQNYVGPTRTHINVYMTDFALDEHVANCGNVNFHLTLFKGPDENFPSFRTSDFIINVNRHVENGWSSIQKAALWNSSDLFIRDNRFDRGLEPFYEYDFYKGGLTKGFSVFNRNLDPYLLWNINTSANQPPMRSVLGNENIMHVQVENRGCQTSSGNNSIEMFWTINRVWEPWGKDWHNYQNYPAFASENKVEYPIGSGSYYPAGNHITIADPLNYYSPATPQHVPPVAPLFFGGPYGQDAAGGYTAIRYWKSPDPSWYSPLNLPGVFMNSPLEPVICYLAVLKEGDKPQSGLFDNTEPWEDPTYKITDYAMNNNNVATVNSYIATNNGSYKTKLTNSDGGDPTYYSNGAFIYVNNPHGLSSVNLSAIPDEGCPQFEGINGNIYFAFDETLWASWLGSDGETSGSGFEVIENRLIKVTDLANLKLTNFELYNNSMGVLAVMYEYFGNNLPESDYSHSFSFGAYNDSPTNHIGAPTHFMSDVYAYPFSEDEGDGLLREAKKKSANSSSSLFVYPNPLNNNLNISISQNKINCIEVINSKGHVMEKISNPTLSTHSTINTESWNPDIYILKITTFTGEVYYRKVSKQ